MLYYVSGTLLGKEIEQETKQTKILPLWTLYSSAGIQTIDEDKYIYDTVEGDN